MAKKIEIKSGDRYGKLTIIKEIEPYVSSTNKKSRKFECLCDCGNKTEVILHLLRSNHTKSCGCIRKNVEQKIKISKGDKYGKLTIIEELDLHIRPDGKKDRRVKCICECQNTTYLLLSHLRRGTIKSCGCIKKEANTTHGYSRTPTYKSWLSMKERCLRETHINYKDYGGRGIKIYEKWIMSFENFLKDMGERPGLNYSIDRINNNGNYEPSNCRWATFKEQSNNRRKRKCLAENVNQKGNQ